MTEVATISSIKLRAMEESPLELKRFIENLHAEYSDLGRTNLRECLLEFLRDTATTEPKQDDAVKHDEGKAEYHLLPNDVIQQVGLVLAFGASAQKYGPHNWRKGMDWSRMYNAANRHMVAFWEGEDLDQESGLPHLAHAITCLMFLCSYYLNKNGYDDRYEPPIGDARLGDFKVSDVFKDYAEQMKKDANELQKVFHREQNKDVD